MMRSSRLFSCVLVLIGVCALGCRHAGKMETKGCGGKACAAVAGGSGENMPAQKTKSRLAPRKQYVIEMEVIAMPTKAYGKVDEGLRVQVDSGRVDAYAIHRFMSNSQTRILLRPRLFIVDGEDGKLISGPSSATVPLARLEASFSPVSQPDGAVRLGEVLTIPLLDSKGKVGTDPARAIHHKSERVMTPSPDWCYSERFQERDGYEYVVFTRIFEN